MDTVSNNLIKKDLDNILDMEKVSGVNFYQEYDETAPFQRSLY